ncbi:hypothetical protein TIFTF001_021628 [Ficus carica]|uniref:Retrotransposon gag domain-containing protein n=1 Tax=Ficus carica TaxID=3494 RepID=A0AA88DC20_FICCA|nr:hypothetical protein TIFTF001_021628 [Ficus carica]
MPSMASYDGTTGADEHLENYQAYMLIQNANETALCKSFCLTLTRAARQWYQRLAPRLIGCFKQLANAFATAFLGSRTRKLEASHRFGIKQGEAETLKKYLERFDKIVVQLESCSDDTLRARSSSPKATPTSRKEAIEKSIRSEPTREGKGRGRRCQDRDCSRSENTGGEVSPIHPAGHNHRARFESGVWSGTTPGCTANLSRSYSKKPKQVRQLPQGHGPRHEGLHTALRPDRAIDPMTATCGSLWKE